MSESATRSHYQRAGLVFFVLMVSIFSQQFTDFSHTKELIACLGLCVLSWMHLYAPNATFRVPRFFLVLGIGISILAAVHSLFPITDFPDFIVHRSVSYLLAIALASYLLCESNDDNTEDRVKRLLFASTFVVIILTLIQFLNLAPKLFPAYPGFENNLYSVFGNQNLLGGYLALSIPVLLLSASQEEKRGWPQFVLLIACVATCLATGSRSAWLAAAVGCLMILPRIHPGRREVIGFFILIMTGFAMVLITPGPTIERILHTFSLEDVGYNVRVWIWAGSVNLISDHPFIGIGPGDFPYMSPKALADVLHEANGFRFQSNTVHTWLTHSTPLELIVEFGVGGWAICAGWITMLIRGRKGMLWGGAIAFTVYAALNSVQTSAPHMLIGLMLFASLPSTKWITRTSEERGGGRVAKLVISTTAGLLILIHIGGILLPDHLHAQARSLYRAGDESDTTIATYEQASEYRYASPHVHLELGISKLFATGLAPAEQPTNLESAHAHLLRAHEQLDTGELHLLLGQSFLRLGDTTTAIEHTRLGVYRWPQYRLGWEQLIRQSSPPDRAASFDEARQWLSSEQFQRFEASARSLPGLNGQNTDNVESDGLSP
ncbi:MAG: O-antigen ligase family protein [Candidatus Hydrogenedentota bacterium]